MLAGAAAVSAPWSHSAAKEATERYPPAIAAGPPVHVDPGVEVRYDGL
jgi:hypothetical protein